MWLASAASGASWKRPPFSGSSSAANTVGESNLGKHRKSIAPSMPTSATVLVSPTMPWFSTGCRVMHRSRAGTPADVEGPAPRCVNECPLQLPW